MLKIGDFSKLAHVSVKTLRFYADNGLLKPAWIDRFTGYRFYSLEQLPRLNRILALKDLGFSLDQITALLDEQLTAAQLRGMLRQKQLELETRLQAEMNRLDMVAARLLQIEQEGSLPASEVLIKRIPPLSIATLAENVASLDRLPTVLRHLSHTLQQRLNAAGLQPDGPWMTLYTLNEYRESDIPLEMGVPVKPDAQARAADEADFNLRLLPAVDRMACLVHTGRSETIPQAYTGLYGWMDTHRYQAAGPARELYLSEDKASQDIGAVEIQIPLERVGPIKLEDKMNQPKIINRDAFTVIGYCYQGNNANQEIAEMWGRFVQRLNEIQSNNPYETFGVCKMIEGLPEGHFEYVAAMQVPADAPVPEGMVKRSLPALKYAVFEHTGALNTLGKTYQAIYNGGLQAAGLEPMESGFDMEVYDDRVFNNFSPESILYIYVPVK